ncbi:CPX chromosomal region candidate gene 1 protein [Ochotona curzoniae]|uniref:CPX chromosomal region candidate gene 1 protein n=1 Tax=Ochotona curzoniae TaxID=130825 RepID=UPI001B353963|nr:CPX chromosomal region candidate gene 1 protein [Ochotona curzoniae]
MTTPIEKGNGSAGSALKNAEVEARDNCNVDTEPSAIDPKLISQVETNPGDVDSTVSNSHKRSVSQVGEKNESNPEKTQKSPQIEDFKQKSLLGKMPFSRKFFLSGFGRGIYLNVPLQSIARYNNFTNLPRFYSGQMEMDKNDFCNTINFKIPLRYSIPWRVPLANNCDIKGIFHTLQGGNFSHIVGNQSTMHVKQKYMAFVSRPNVLIHGERYMELRKPLRKFYHLSLMNRRACSKFYETNDTEVMSEYDTMVRLVFHAPRTYTENIFRKDFNDDLRSHHDTRVVNVSTNDGWEYLCPNCRNTFTNLVDIKQHSCSSPGN